MKVWGGEASDFPIAEDIRGWTESCLRYTVSGKERVGPAVKTLAFSDSSVP